MSDTPATTDTASPLARFFFSKSIFGTLLTLLCVLSGALAYQAMVKESLPDLAIPQATVTTEWPGADPETIEQQVTNKIEKKLKSLRGLRRLRSASFDSYSVIAVEFLADADLGESMQLLRSKVSDAEPDLPSQAKKPKIAQVSVDDTPILTVVLVGDVEAAILGQAAKELKDALEKVPGVNKVTVAGRRKEVIRIRLFPGRIAGLGISPTVVQQRIQSANLDMPWARIESEELGSTVRFLGRFRSVEDLERLPVARLGAGRLVRLGEIAEVRRDLERERSRASLSWRGEPFRPAVEVSLTKFPGVDALEVIGKATAAVECFAASSQWPHGLEYHVTSDESVKIWANLASVFRNAWQAMLCVFIVLLVMLTWREALVAGLSIPVTFLGALAGIHLVGYTLNEMVIIGMVLALGLLVDVFILMMEGMHEGIFVEQLSFEQASTKTVRSYALPALAGQATTIIAMIPLLAIGGIDGKFIRVIPVTMIVCLVLSYVIALLVDVPLSRLVLGKLVGSKSRATWVDRLTKRSSNWLCDWSLRATVRSRGTALAWTAGLMAVLALSLVAASRLPVLLYPPCDGRKLGITVELPPESTLSTAQRCADELGEILRQKPYLESVVKIAGRKSSLAQNSIAEALTPSEDTYIVGFSCIFTRRQERARLSVHYLDDLREELASAIRASYPGTGLVLTGDTGSPTTEDPVQIELLGNDMERLRQLSAQVQDALATVPGATDVRDNLGPVRATVRVLPKREALDFYEIAADDLAQQIRFAMTDDEVGKFPAGGLQEDLEIRLSTAWPSRRGTLGGPTRLDELATIRAFRPNTHTVPLLAVITPVYGTAPLCTTHKNSQRYVTVMSKTSGRTVSAILGDMEPLLQQRKQDWPPGYSYHFAGEAENAAETYGSSGRMLLIAVVLVFALLVLLFRSFAQPFVILLIVPLSFIGVFGGFYLIGMPFSFPAMVGVISLVGIVVNDAIVMVETMNAHRQAGLDLQTAAARGGADRLRPILTTSITTIVGLTPLALSDPMWTPLCSAIIFGLTAATVISLLLIPCLYLLFSSSKTG